MKKILVITYFFKPLTSNQSFRYERIIERLNNNVEVDIVTSLHEGLNKEEVDKNVKIYRENNRLLKKGENFHPNKDKSEIDQKTKTSKLKTIVNSIARIFMWPDFAFLWIFPAYRKARKLLKQNDYDMIYTVSFPFSAHLVGMFLKLKNKNIKWTIDYIDPFSIINKNENPANNVKLYKKLNHHIEKRVNLKADRIFLLEEAHEKFIHTFPEVVDKVTIIPPMVGIDTRKYKLSEPYDFGNLGVNIVYAGTFYRSIRNPEPFLKLFLELVKKQSNIYLHIIGDSKDCADILDKYKKILPRNILIYGKLPRELTLSYLKGADVLLNIANSSYSQLPGKVVEYLYAEKKIINFSSIKNNNSSVFFRNNSMPKQVIEIYESNYDLDLLLNYLNRKVNISGVNIDKFSPENILKIYFGGNE